MSHGFREVRTVRMEPGPDGRPVPHVYIERRELTEEEARKLLEEQQAAFSGFEGIFAGFDSVFARMDDMFKKVFGRHGR